MHPAYSIIVFTAASGAGYGLVFAMAALALAGALPGGAGFTAVAFGLALALITSGLLASTLHLGRPERAWRALSQWRSSWLSREGVAALAAFPVIGLFALARLLGAGDATTAALALASAAACAATVVCTAMIYASLQPVRRWRNAWVVPGYLALGLMTGALWLYAVAALLGAARPAMAWLAAVALVAAWAIKVGYWRTIDGDEGDSTAESATGLGSLGPVRLFEAPHTSDNYVMKEMGYRVARKHARKLRRAAQWGGFAAPLALILAAAAAPGWPGALFALAAALLAGAGTLVERWLFFAEAKHSVTLYYGANRA